MSGHTADQHQVDAVGAACNQCHHDDAYYRHAVKRGKHDGPREGPGQEQVCRGADFAFQEAQQQRGQQDAEHAEQRERRGRKDGAGVAHAEGLAHVDRHPCSDAVPQDSLEDDGNQDGCQGRVRQQPEEEGLFVCRFRIGAGCRFRYRLGAADGYRAGYGIFHAVRGRFPFLHWPAGCELAGICQPYGGGSQTQGRREVEDGLPAGQLDAHGREYVDGDGGRGGRHGHQHAAVSVPFVAEAFGHDPHHGGPEHGLEEAVGAPDGGDDLHSGDEGHCQVAGAGSGQSGEDHELGLHFVPQEAADYLAQAIA